MPRDFATTDQRLNRETVGFTVGDLKFTNEQGPNSEPPSHTESAENRDYRDVAPGELKLSELASQDEAVGGFKSAVLEGIARSIARRREQPAMGYSDLNSSLDKVLEGLQKEYPDYSLDQVVKLGPLLKDKIFEIIPPQPKVDLEKMPIPDNVAAELVPALAKLRADIEDYERQNADFYSPSLGKKNGKWISNIRGNSDQASEPKFSKEDLQKSLNVLAELSQAKTLTKELLEKKIIYLDNRSKQPDTAGLGNAIEYSGQPLRPSLESYVKRINHTEKAQDEVIPDKIYEALNKMAQGYGEEVFEDDEAQFAAGTTTNPGGANADYMRAGVVETLKLRKNPDAGN